MQAAWVQQKGQNQCILFFSGWGMDPSPFATIAPPDADLFMVYDYRELTPVDLTPLEGYAHCHLLAWSMGVWVAAHLLAGKEQRFTSRTAVGGTLQPIDAKLGIPPQQYAHMVEHFSPDILHGFYRNMFDDESQHQRFLSQRPQREISDIHQELASFRDAVAQSGVPVDIYQQKWITSHDRIFSARNQMRAWGKGVGIVRNWPHFFFFMDNSWNELLFLTDHSV